MHSLSPPALSFHSPLCSEQCDSLDFALEVKAAAAVEKWYNVRECPLLLTLFV
jgi:hypothetical protein